MSFSNNVRAGETDTSSEQLWLMLKNEKVLTFLRLALTFENCDLKAIALGHLSVTAFYNYFLFTTETRCEIRIH